MKRILVSMVMVALAIVAFAGDNSGKAAILIPQIKNYLAQEGYVASVDSDNDIKFKTEGDTYYISVQNYDDGCYIDMYTLSDISGINFTNVLRAANKTQTSLKYVRVDVISEKTLSVGAVGFYSNVGQFKTMFDNLLSVIHTADKRFIEKLIELND